MRRILFPRVTRFIGPRAVARGQDEGWFRGRDIATSPDGKTVFIFGGTTPGVGFLNVVIHAYATLEPLGLVARLTEDVMELNLPHGVEGSLQAKLDTASRLLRDHLFTNDAGAASVLAGFIRVVQGQAGKEIQEVDARRLTTLAADAIQLIEAELD